MIKQNNKQYVHQNVVSTAAESMSPPLLYPQSAYIHYSFREKSQFLEYDLHPIQQPVQVQNHTEHKLNLSRQDKLAGQSDSKYRSDRNIQKSKKKSTVKKEMLIIIPNRIEMAETRYKQNYQSNSYCDKLLRINRVISEFTEETIDPPSQIRTNKSRAINERKILNRLSCKDQLLSSKMKMLSHKAKLKPIENISRQQDAYKTEVSFQILGPQKEGAYFVQLQGSKDQKKGKQILKSKFVGDHRRLIKTLEKKFYHLGQSNFQNGFHIQSIEPNLSALQKTPVQLRRNTQPNIQVEQTQTSQAKIKSLCYNFQRQQINRPEQPNCLASCYQPTIGKSPKKDKALLLRRRRFNPPFQTYHYRELLWKLNYSNALFVEPPLEYDHRLKVFVGSGNNSAMVRGLISRRYWFAITDRIEDANFVWTQLKQLQYYKVQNSLKSTKIKNCQSGKKYVQLSLFNQQDNRKFKDYWQAHLRSEQHSDQRFLTRLKYFSYNSTIRGQSIKHSRMHNHLMNNYVIGNKKSLLNTMTLFFKSQQLDFISYMPTTFHVKQGIEDAKFLEFQRYFHLRNREIKKKAERKLNLWIVKPGENSNRGNGIKLCLNLAEIKSIVKQKQKWSDGSEKTFIIQSYIQNPLLYHRRKFDIRHYLLTTCINGHMKGYWYKQGYVRTTASEYKLQTNDSAIHLTNDAVQKNLATYGKYQKGNKLSYSQLDQYISKMYKNKGFFTHVYPNMKKIASDIMKASINYLDPERLSHNFELFGLDFMIDSDLKVWLIQVNTNPCLQLSCPLLSKIIPNLIEDVLEMTMDVIYPPAVRYSAKLPRYFSKTEEINKFEMIFDDRIEKGMEGVTGVLNGALLEEQEDFFQDDGEQWEQQII